MSKVRTLVVEAINKATGFLNETDNYRKISSGADLNLADLDLDSLSQFEIIMEIEQALSIEIDADDLFANETLDAVVARIESLIGANDG